MSQLVGIAKMAAESPSIEVKRRVEYLDLASRSLLTRCTSPRVPFEWTINPYRGCEFGCKYCYARYTHEFMELRDPESFERRIFVKHFEPAPFRKELAQVSDGESIALGTATDPYQPAERRFGITRGILQVFAASGGFRLGITTKSDLVARDADLLREIARRNYLSVHITVTTLDCDLARLIEPLAPRPDLRLDAVRKLSEAGIRVTVGCMPVLPLINDSEASLDAVAGAARAAGAVGFIGHVVFLKQCARDVFFPFLEQHFPALLRRYRERFEKSAYVSGAYPKMISERFRVVRERHGFVKGFAGPEPELWPHDPQLLLFP